MHLLVVLYLNLYLYPAVLLLSPHVQKLLTRNLIVIAVYVVAGSHLTLFNYGQRVGEPHTMLRDRKYMLGYPKCKCREGNHKGTIHIWTQE